VPVLLLRSLNNFRQLTLKEPQKWGSFLFRMHFWEYNRSFNEGISMSDPEKQTTFDNQTKPENTTDQNEVIEITVEPLAFSAESLLAGLA
jgi:hypothetical protein